jgi:ABC-type Fe3+ transport system permease subunit
VGVFYVSRKTKKKQTGTQKNKPEPIGRRHLRRALVLEVICIFSIFFFTTTTTLLVEGVKNRTNESNNAKQQEFCLVCWKASSDGG